MNYKKIFYFIFLGFLTLSPLFVFANNSTKYTTLSNISKLEVDTANSTDIPNFINTLISLTIAVAAGLAVIMIVWGGIERMTKDSIQKATDGRKRIENAIYGLLIALSAYLLLKTINPKLLNLDFNVNPVTIQSVTISAGYLPLGGRTTEEKAIAGSTPAGPIAMDPNFNPELGTAQDMTVRSTMYSAGEKNSDAYTDALQSSTGVRLRAADDNTVGVAAVDPSIIPYGSLIKVDTGDGPRYYIAADTGGAVKNQTASGGKAPVIDFYSKTQVGTDYSKVTVTPYTGSKSFASLSSSQKEAFFDVNKYKNK